jgi:hypothetical protein
MSGPGYDAAPIREVAVTIRMQVSVLAVLLLAGCLTPAGKPRASSSCSFDQVWDTAIVSLEGLRLESAEKAKGVLETAWVEVEGTTRAGAFQREVTRERVKYVVEVKRDGAGAGATVLQRREEWSPMGVLSRQWRAVPGNPTEEEAVVAEMARRLKEKGC